MPSQPASIAASKAAMVFSGALVLRPRCEIASGKLRFEYIGFVEVQAE
jgi:hypothetical protein